MEARLAVDGQREAGTVELSDGQRELIELIQSLDPDLRHTIKIVCRGTEPAQMERISEQVDLGLRVSRYA